MDRHRHDALFKSVFSIPEHVRDELQAVLPPALLPLLDLDIITPAPEGWVDEKLRERTGDVVYRVPLLDTAAYVVILMEHQSTSDQAMPLRLIRYMLNVWERHDAERSAGDSDEAGPLPVVLPIVVEHAPGGWRAARRFSGLFGLDDSVRKLVAPYIPDFTYIVDSLPEQSAAALAARSESPFFRLAVWSLRLHGRAPDNEEWAAWRAEFARISHLEDERAYSALIHYHRVTDPPVVVERARTVTRWAEETFMNKYEQGIKDAVDAATAEAAARLAELAREALDDKRGLLTDQLRVRFGAISPSHKALIQSAGDATLTTWFHRVVLVESIDEVFEDA